MNATRCSAYRDLPGLPDPLVRLRQSRRAMLRNLRAKPDTLAAFLLPQALGSYRRLRAAVVAPVVLP